MTCGIFPWGALRLDCLRFRYFYLFCIREKARPLQWEGGDAVLRRAPECVSDSVTMVAVSGRSESSPNPCDHLLWGNGSHLFFLSQSSSPGVKWEANISAAQLSPGPEGQVDGRRSVKVFVVTQEEERRIEHKGAPPPEGGLMLSRDHRDPKLFIFHFSMAGHRAVQ